MKPAARGQSKHRKVMVPEPVDNVPHRTTSFGTMMKEARYATCVAGKWHISQDPSEFGFDTNFGSNRSGAPRGGYFSPYRNPQLSDGHKVEHLTDRLGKEVSNWIVENKDKPFFVYFPFYSVHTPIQAHEDLTQKYQ
ncbi:sulfatase-like hydrolase/transferase [Coraliomargarita algicola]|uniref:Sulfatase-like hydrolase/transferase n=1 Tax=Coraliomargarita algicola TaxID=3092156 RepID=A0ABZ0RIN3_9BACT|nr:sulfatase-like hydrolase/transferase [Coraliomargarita sp. J2-16]WPJ95382.1 sulfatase-like hydrolase/transferase [Coraliomargarita sp. J2-16]